MPTNGWQRRHDEFGFEALRVPRDAGSLIRQGATRSIPGGKVGRDERTDHGAELADLEERLYAEGRGYQLSRGAGACRDWIPRQRGVICIGRSVTRRRRSQVQRPTDEEADQHFLLRIGGRYNRGDGASRSQ